jgi:hypothetical protein
MTTKRLYRKGEPTKEAFHVQVPIECPNCEAPYFFRVFFAGGEGRSKSGPFSDAEKREVVRMAELAINALRETCPQHVRDFEC